MARERTCQYVTNLQTYHLVMDAFHLVADSFQQALYDLPLLVPPLALHRNFLVPPGLLLVLALALCRRLPGED